MNVFLFVCLLAFVSSSCVRVVTNPKGKTPERLVEVKNGKKQPSRKDLITGLSRSTLLPGGVYEAVYVVATLQTPALAYRRLEQRAKRENWEKDRFEIRVEQMIARQKRELCFDFLVKANNEAATEASKWSIMLQQDGDLQRLTDLRFRKQRPNSKVAAASSSFRHIPKDMRYFLESTICFDRHHEDIGEIVLIVDPQFDDRPEAATLSWRF
ncbi:MAG: hypothetical protein HRU19_11170 [Pseudobacteriovorax sp.]|nr:hypothetical protein [Pseudobacteriovorax sp.]